MFKPDGSISFVSELMDAVDAFLRTFAEEQGELDSELERALVMAYALGVLRCDLESIQTILGEAAVFGPVDPFALFDRCKADRDDKLEKRRAAIESRLRERGWID